MERNCKHPTCSGTCRRPVKEQKTYLLKRTPLKIKPYIIPQESAKRKADIVVYRMLRRPFLAARPVCEINAHGCTKLSCVVHHTKGRILFYLTVSTWLASCRHCNTYIETHDAWARERGFLGSKFEV